MFREPQRCQLGGGENDEGLSQGTKGLTHKHYRVLDFKTLHRQCPAGAQQGSNHVQPGSQNQLKEGWNVKMLTDLSSNLHSIPPFLVLRANSCYVSARHFSKIACESRSVLFFLWFSVHGVSVGDALVFVSLSMAAFAPRLLDSKYLQWIKFYEVWFAYMCINLQIRIVKNVQVLVSHQIDPIQTTEQYSLHFFLYAVIVQIFCKKICLSLVSYSLAPTCSK